VAGHKISLQTRDVRNVEQYPVSSGQITPPRYPLPISYWIVLTFVTKSGNALNKSLLKTA